MKLNKEKFLKSEPGSSLKECITAWDRWLDELCRQAGIRGVRGDEGMMGELESVEDMHSRLEQLKQKLAVNRRNLSEIELETKYKEPYGKLLEEITELEGKLGSQ